MITQNVPKTTRFRNYLFTWNNPPCSIEQVKDKASRLSIKAFAGQTEVGEKGTEHHQFFIGFKAGRTHHAVTTEWRGCHVVQCNSPFDAWEYCTKEATRKPGGHPLTIGVPPLRRNSKLDIKKFNKMCLEKGAEAMV